mgnify:CR=1 FL=1
MAGKLWDKGFEPDTMIEEYTVGQDRELDLRLARYDVEGSLAHIAMLEKIGLLTADELRRLTDGLHEIAAETRGRVLRDRTRHGGCPLRGRAAAHPPAGRRGQEDPLGTLAQRPGTVDLKLFLRDELRASPATSARSSTACRSRASATARC